MINKLINQYLDNLTIADIKTISRNQNITLNDKECITIYNYIINDWKTLVYGNHTFIFNKLKSEINNDAYNKILSLFNEYKNNYKNYL